MRWNKSLALWALWSIFAVANCNAYFDPEVGRYLTRDPIGYADGMNVYAYVHNNPINHIDPLGLADEDDKSKAESSTWDVIEMHLTLLRARITGETLLIGGPTYKKANEQQNQAIDTIKKTQEKVYEVQEKLNEATPEGQIKKAIKHQVRDFQDKNDSIVGPPDSSKAQTDKAIETLTDAVVDAAGDAANRNAALREAKRDSNIPMTQHPETVKSVPMTDQSGKVVIGGDGKPIMTREYTYSRSDGSRIAIQEHTAGHEFPKNGGKVGPHFNVRPVNANGEVDRHGTVDGTKDHYPVKN